VTQQGRGLAPIGHDVLVLTPTGFSVTVTATITHETGYSLTGAGGTIATHATIEAAIRRYIDGLDVGDDVVRNKVVAAIVDVTGVANVTTTGGSALAVNGATTETVAVPATEVAVSSTITLA
jgi:hypothetical protein